VAGGAGAVGHYAIELARRAGARVVTTVSSAEKADLAAKAGAAWVHWYNTGRLMHRTGLRPPAEADAAWWAGHDR